MNMKARITGWDAFLNKRTGELYRYHPIIPFKKYDKIVRQIAGAVENNYRLGEYNLFNRNCEHFASALILGIDLSKQMLKDNHHFWYSVLEKKVGITRNNGKGETIKLTEERKKCKKSAK